MMVDWCFFAICIPFQAVISIYFIYYLWHGVCFLKYLFLVLGSTIDDPSRKKHDTFQGNWEFNVITLWFWDFTVAKGCQLIDF